MSTNQKVLSNPIVNNPGLGYKNGETITIDLDGTNTVTGTIVVTTEGVDEGWFASNGKDIILFLQTSMVTTTVAPTFKYGMQK